MTVTATHADEETLRARIEAGEDIERLDEMTPEYRDVLTATIGIAADLEVMSLPLLYTALLNAPDIDAKIAVASGIQDEMGHAQMMYRLLEDFGLDSQWLIFEREPRSFRTFYILEHGCDDYLEFICMQAYGDRAGYITTRDLGEHCSFAPYRRSLAKVNYEQRFHVRHGEHEIRRILKERPDLRPRIQGIVDVLFPMAAEWFGTTDDRKSRTGQITYRIRGATNDELRQQWLSSAVPFSESVGIEVPAHFDEATQQYELDYQLPVLFDEEKRVWDLEHTVTWEEKFAQWKRGGPRKLPGVALIQGERWGAELWS